MGPERRTLTLAPDEIAALTGQYHLNVGAASPLGPFAGTEPMAGTRSLGARGLLDDGWRQALTVLARPDHQVRSLIPAPLESLISVYYGSRAVGGGDLVACSARRDGVNISFPWVARDIAAITALTLLPMPPPTAESVSTELTPAGLTALAAAVDVSRATLLDSLQRRLPQMETRISLHDLMDHLEVGLSHNDARWIVTLLNVIASPFVPLVPARLGDGVGELLALGFLTRDGETLRPGPILERLAVQWRSPLPAAAHEVITMWDGEVKAVGHRIAIRGDGPLWVMDYRGILQGAPRVSLGTVDAADYLEGLVEMIQVPGRVGAPRETSVSSSQPRTAPAAQRERGGTPEATEVARKPSRRPRRERTTRCQHCGAALKQPSRFCPSCGKNPSGVHEAAPVSCAQCGAALAPEKKFCTRCGTRVGGG